MGVYAGFLFCRAVLLLLNKFAIIPLRMTPLVALCFTYSEYNVSVIVLCLFLTVQRVSLYCVIVAFTEYTHFLFDVTRLNKSISFDHINRF